MAFLESLLRFGVSFKNIFEAARAQVMVALGTEHDGCGLVSDCLVQWLALRAPEKLAGGVFLDQA